MDSPRVRRNTPWLDMPLVFSGNYREYECALNETWQCDYQQGYWRFWYEADHRYALPAVAFFLAVIAVFTLGSILSSILPRRFLQTRAMTKTRALFRYLSYRMIRTPSLDWNSAPVGVLMLGAVGTVFFLTMTLGPQPYYWPNTDEVDYGSSPPIATRTGWMALACMPFVFATAGKANFITLCTGVSHEKLQVFHRWISYAFFVLSLIHTFPFIIYNIEMDMMPDMWNGMVFYWTGVVALVAQAWLTFASWGPLRNLCYEWFKFSHFVAALVFTLFLFFHCDATLTAWDYFVATGVLFSLSWLYRHIRIYFEHGIGHHAELSLAPNGFIRVGIPTNTTWTVGQHYFIRFLTLGMHAWTIHPFTACSLPLHGRQDLPNGLQSELVFFIRPRGGFTARLARLVESRPRINVRVLLDGPYGGVKTETIRKHQRMLVIAGGSGAGWALPFIISFLKRPGKDVSAADVSLQPSLKVVLVTRDPVTADWIEAEVQQLLDSMHIAPKSALEIQIYYTGSQTKGDNPTKTGQFLEALNKPEIISTREQDDAGPASKSETSGSHLREVNSIQHLETRPDLAAMVRKETEAIPEGQSVGVFVCGPLSMQSDVSNAVAREQLHVAKRGTGDIYLHMEHFSWA